MNVAYVAQFARSNAVLTSVPMDENYFLQQNRPTRLTE